MTKHTLLLLMLFALLLAPGAQSFAAKASSGYTCCENVDQDMLREKWGIELVTLHVGAGGYIVDFRYRVVDPSKAAPLGERTLKPYLEDVATNTKLIVPAPAKVGALRNKPQEYKTGRVYFIEFANPGRIIKPGAKVNVAVGDLLVENVIVQ